MVNSFCNNCGARYLISVPQCRLLFPALEYMLLTCNNSHGSASMHLPTAPVGSCSQCLTPRTCYFKTHLPNKRLHRQLLCVRGASSEAPASKSQTDLFKQLGQVCSEMGKAPPSVVSCSNKENNRQAIALYVDSDPDICCTETRVHH